MLLSTDIQMPIVQNKNDFSFDALSLDHVFTYYNNEDHNYDFTRTKYIALKNFISKIEKFLKV